MGEIIREIKSMSDEELKKRLDKMKEEMRKRERKSTAPEPDYEKFKNTIEGTLESVDEPLRWSEIKVRCGLKQKVPNNKWVHWLEKDIGLIREKKKGVTYWKLD